MRKLPVTIKGLYPLNKSWGTRVPRVAYCRKQNLWEEGSWRIRREDRWSAEEKAWVVHEIEGSQSAGTHHRCEGLLKKKASHPTSGFILLSSRELHLRKDQASTRQKASASGDRGSCGGPLLWNVRNSLSRQLLPLSLAYHNTFMHFGCSYVVSHLWICN